MLFMKLWISVMCGLVIGESKILKCHVERKESVFQHLDVFSFDAKSNNFTVRVDGQQQLDAVMQAARCTVMEMDMVSLLGQVPEGEGRSKRSPLGLQAAQFFKDYQSYWTMKATLDLWSKRYPQIATFTPSIGKTHEGRHIFAFKITSPSRHRTKKGIWFNGGQHAREWISPAATIYLIHKFLTRAHTPKVKKLLDGFEFHFTPLANPDGYEFSRRPGNRLWRKNRRNNGDGTFGVDLNRNWDARWGSVEGHCSSSREVYQGLYPHSEPEVQALANYSRKIPSGYGGIDFHSYGQYILRNWGYAKIPSLNDKLLVRLGHAMQTAFKKKGYNYTSQPSSSLYPASGTLSDYMAMKENLISLSVELCPADFSSTRFQLPARSIIHCSRAAFAATLAFSEFLLLHPTQRPV